MQLLLCGKPSPKGRTHFLTDVTSSELFTLFSRLEYLSLTFVQVVIFIKANSRPSGCLWKPLAEGIGRGDIWPIGYILLCREHHRLGQLEKELAILPNPWRVSSSGDWELLAASRGSRVVSRTPW